MTDLERLLERVEADRDQWKAWAIKLQSPPGLEEPAPGEAIDDYLMRIPCGHKWVVPGALMRLVARVRSETKLALPQKEK